MSIRVLEGERPISSANFVLGEFELSEIPSTHKGGVKVEVMFEIDVSVFAPEAVKVRMARLTRELVNDIIGQLQFAGCRHGN
jgi:molecular chaperone DnaK (HSP70)